MSATEELRRLLDERGVEWTAPNSILRDEMTSWTASGFYYDAFEVPEPDGTFLLTAAHQDELTPEQVVEATLGDKRLTFLEEKVKLQGEYIAKLTEEKKVLLAQNCEAATRHAGQMDYMQRKLETATLGRGECKLPETRIDHGSIEYNGVTEWRRCSACGAEVLAYPAHYCPSCGRRVVK